VLSELEGFARDYKTKAIPPPHILLVCSDEEKCADVADEFSRQLGVKLTREDAAKINIQGDLTVHLCDKGVFLIENIQSLKRTFVDNLARALHEGHYEILIGSGPAMRSHKHDLSAMTVIATCPSRYEVPAPLVPEFRCVLHIEPHSETELLSRLEAEGWKNRITFEPDAAALLVRCSGGQTKRLLSVFQRAVSVIEQVKTTNKPHITKLEILDALARCRIAVPAETSRLGALNLQTLSGHEFERVVMLLLTKMGFHAELTEVTGDGGIDLIATLDRPFVGGKYLFQCKRYAPENLVGSPAVRDFYGAIVANKAVKGVFVTTSDFSAHAKEFC